MAELPSILQSLEDMTILVTGATGFLAKIFIEKILRVQPKVKKLYLLLRAEDSKSATERLHNEVIAKELFDVVREKYGASLYSFLSEKVTPIPGDVSKEDLGVKNSNLREELQRESNVIVNLAAATEFDGRYDELLGVNTFGALHVLNFAKKCGKIKILVHVSTAYVCGEDVGFLPERPFSMGETKRGIDKIDIHVENQLIQQKLDELKSNDVTEKSITSSMKAFGLERAKLYGWPNTYVFTKAMGEMLVVHFKSNDIPIVIIRPTMVTSTCKEPFSGWIEGLRTIDSVIAGYARGKLKCFACNLDSTVDLIPADMVINGMIVAMVKNMDRHDSEIVYHLGSSFRNPFKYSNLRDMSLRYFSKNPWMNKERKPVKVGKCKILRSMSTFHMYMTIRYCVPLKALNLLKVVSSQRYKDKLNVLNKKVKMVMRLMELYKPYAFFEGIFDDTNTQKLQIIAIKTYADADSFGFDPKTIDWEDYMMKAHFVGLIKYVITN